VPSGSGGHLLSALGDQWPSYLGYAVSFSTIGAVWTAHTAVTEYLDRTTGGLLRLNLVLLMVVAFLPFPTKLLAEYIHETEPERIATTLYGINLLLTVALVSALWRYAVHERLVRSELADDEVDTLTKKLTPGLAGYVLLIVIGLFFPIVAVVGYLAIALFILLPISALRRRSSRT
jgi:uncharacterized membrane protein